MATSLLFFLICLRFVFSETDAKNAEISQPGLELKRVDQDEVEGCWTDPGQAFPVCFHISSKLMRITHGPDGDIPLVLYYTNKLRNIHYIQAIGNELLRYKSLDITIPNLISKSLLFKAIKRKVKKESVSDLYFFLKKIPRLSKAWGLTQKVGKRALTGNEAAALDKISSALKKHPLTSRFPKAVEQFHLLCLGLIRSVGPYGLYTKQTWPSSNAKRSYNSRSPYAPDNNTSTAKRKSTSSFSHLQGDDAENDIASPSFTNHTLAKGELQGPGNHDNSSANQQVGCQDMRNGSDRECFGMCGARCWCWDWLCGDCCLHTGCLQHDACCRHAKPVYLSTYCLLPFIYGFDCKRGYMGYPKCLHDSPLFHLHLKVY